MSKADADALKEKGNAAFKAQDYDEALRLYSEAMELDSKNVAYPLNRCMTNLKLERWSEAEADATKALGLSAKEVKALYRRSIARKEQKNFRGAKQDIWAFSDAGGGWTHLKDQCEKISASEAEGITNDGFEIRQSEGKGLGAFATRTFQRGDLILAEKPLFTITNTWHNIIRAAVAGLSESQRETFMSLSAGPSDRYHDPVLNRFFTNAFAAVIDRVKNNCILPVASRFNHSCMRNARYGWNENGRQLRIYALRDIAAGEELVVSFLGSSERHRGTRRERQAFLENNWGFVCTCSLCVLSEPERLRSDRRRLDIARIHHGLQSLTVPFQGEEFMTAIMSIVRIMKEEGFSGEFADLTKEVAAHCAVHSDWKSVEYWAMKTYQIVVEEWGANHNNAKEVRSPADWKRDPPAVYPFHQFNTRLK